MVDNISILDKVHVQKYLYILSLYISKKLLVDDFETLFLKVRQADDYWLSGSFNQRIGGILDKLFLDISDYTSDDLYDPNDSFNINENELQKRVKEAYTVLLEVVNPPG